MSPSLIVRSACGSLFVLILLGCGGSPPSKTASNKSPASATTPASTSGTAEGKKEPEKLTVNVKDLPEPGEPVPPLDGDRVQLRSPAKWVRQPRNDEQYLAMFKLSNATHYPQILLLPAKQTDAEPQTWTRENMEEIAASLAAEKETQTAIVELGDHPWIYYRSVAKTGQTRLDLSTLITQVAGRRYELQLRCVRYTREDYEPFLLAVAKHTQMTASPVAAP